TTTESSSIANTCVNAAGAPPEVSRRPARAPSSGDCAAAICVRMRTQIHASRCVRKQPVQRAMQPSFSRIRTKEVCGYAGATPLHLHALSRLPAGERNYALFCCSPELAAQTDPHG